MSHLKVYMQNATGQYARMAQSNRIASGDLKSFIKFGVEYATIMPLL